MNKHVIMVIMVAIPISAYALFTYDRMVSCAQSGDLDTARKGLTQLMIDQPDRPDLLYDTAVTAYKQQDFSKATAYFEKVARSEASDVKLQELASFNAGNAAVKQKKLQEALDWYDKALQLNPDNEHAKHNKELVKKMLKKQKEDEKKQKKNDKKEKNQDQDQQKDEQQDQEKDNQEKQQNSDNQQKNQQQRQDQSQSDQPEKSHKNQADNSGNESQDKRDKGSQDGNQHNALNDEKNEQKNTQQAENKQPDKKEGSLQPEQKQAASEKKSEKEYGGDKEKQLIEAMLNQKLDPTLARFLESQEKKDAQVNKQLIKAMVGSKGGSRNEDHNW